MNADVEKAIETLECWAFRSDEPVVDSEEWQTIRQALIDQGAEIAALRACAIKYLGWLNVSDPAAGLERDIRDPEMTHITAHLGAEQ